MLLLLLSIIASPDAVFLEHTVTLDCSRPDSGYIELSREVIIPLTARGVRRYRNLTASFRNTWESLEVVAEIHHWRSGRGTSEALIFEKPHIALLSLGRLESSLRELNIQFPGIEIGDTLFIEIKRSIEHLPMADFYSFSFFAASSDSIENGMFRVYWPLERRVIVSTVDLPAPDSTLIDALTFCLTWRTGPQPPISTLPFSTSVADESPFVTVSSHTPSEVSAGLYSILDALLMEDVAETADSILLLCDSLPEKLSGWVSSEIEYLSGDWGTDPGYSPRLPSETLCERSGICRDKSVLLLFMMRKAGYSPFAVLTSLSVDLPELVGSRSFDHMLVAYETGRGDTLFLDPTNPCCSAGFSYTQRGSSYLPLTCSGIGLRTFPDDSTADSLSITLTGRVLPDTGIVEGELDVTFSGAADELFRSMFAGVHDEHVHALLEALFGVLQESDLQLIGDPSDLSNDISVTGHGRWICDVIPRGDSTFLILPGLETLDLVGSRTAAYVLPAFRQNIEIETPYTSLLDLRLTGLSPGAEVPEDFRAGGYRLNFEFRGDTLLMVESLSLLPAVPDPGELEDIREGLLARLSGSLRTVVIP